MVNSKNTLTWWGNCKFFSLWYLCLEWRRVWQNHGGAVILLKRQSVVFAKEIMVVQRESVKLTVNPNVHIVYNVLNAFDICLVFCFSLRFSISIHFLLSYFWEYVPALSSRCNFQQSLSRELGKYSISLSMYNMNPNTLMSYGFCLSIS